MQAVAKPDGRDMSVTELPFNWNADFDIRTLKVGIIQDSFDEITDPAAKANAQKTLETLKAIGVRELVPVTVPDVTTNVSAISVESAVFFDEHARAGRMKGTRSARPSGRLVPAVEWLQSQRVRTMMMMELAKATAHVDVYIVGSNNTGMGGPGGGRTPGSSGPAAAAGGAGGEGGAATPRPADPPRPQTPSQRHFAMANLACYPAINLPERLRGDPHPDQCHDLRAALSGAADSRAGQGVSGRREAPPGEAGQAGRLAREHQPRVSTSLSPGTSGPPRCLPPTGTWNCAAHAAVFVCSWELWIIRQVPPTGSFTSTVIGTALWLRSVIS